MGIGIIPKHVDITLISAWLAEEKRSVIQESVDLFDFVTNLLIFFDGFCGCNWVFTCFQPHECVLSGWI
jgi:hypothetical protein